MRAGGLFFIVECVLCSSDFYQGKMLAKVNSFSTPLHDFVTQPDFRPNFVSGLGQFFSKFSLQGDRERFTHYQPATQRDPEIAPTLSIERGHAAGQNFSGIVNYQRAHTFTNRGMQANLPSASSRNLIRVTNPIALGIQVIQSLGQRVAKGHPFMVTIDDSQFDHGRLNREHA